MPATPATLDTATMTVPTNIGVWTAVITWNVAGTIGNGKKLHVAIGPFAGDPGGAPVEVRDNERWDLGTGAWVSEPGTVGVAGDIDVVPTVTTGDVEAALNSVSALCHVTTVDPSGEDINENGEWLGTFSGGTSALVGADGYARMMMALLPPGRVWRFVGSVLEDFFLACAEELHRLDARVGNLLDESVPSTAVELLPEYESELELESSGSTEERQARVVARHVARQRYRPVDFQTALAPLFGMDAASVPVLERTHAIASSMGDDRLIFEFFVYRDPTLPGAYYLTEAQALIDKIKPSHTVGYAIESIDFSCDDEFSLCDSDLLGA